MPFSSPKCVLAAASAWLLASGLAVFAAPWDGTVPGYSLPVGDNSQLDLGGTAGGALFHSHPHAARDASGVAKLMPRWHRDYDSGLVLGLNATLAVSDPLSRGRYDGDVLEKAFGDVRTGLGRLEVGQTDGAAYDLSVTGPKVDPGVSLDDPQTVFFRDPKTDRAVTDIFPLRTEVGASSNYAKAVYVSPALFGAQLALSFTPGQGKEVLPFLHAGPHVAGRQADIWEGAIRYSDDFGPLSLSAYGGAAFGRAEHKLAGQEGVSDWGAGLRADYSVMDQLSISLGGAWRQSNAYAFQIAQSFKAATTSVRHASAGATYGDWMLGLEYGDGNAGQAGGAPHLSLAGAQASLGYNLSRSIAVTGGWQHQSYARGTGIFYNGSPRLRLDALFLHLNLKTIE